MILNNPMLKSMAPRGVGVTSNSCLNWIFFVLFCLSFLACAKVEEPISQDQVALELLNTGRYSDAVVVLESQINNDPTNDLAKLRLASAYAGEMGFNLIDAFAAFEPLIRFDAKARQLPSPSTISPRTDEVNNSEPSRSSDAAPTDIERDQIKGFERNLMITILDSEMATRVLFNLPYLNESGRSKISRGLPVLRNIPESSPSFRMGLIYESVIHFLLFSNYMRDSFVGVANDSGQATYALSIYCGLDLRVFLKNLPMTFAHLRTGVAALRGAGADANGRFFANVDKSLSGIESLYESYRQSIDLFNVAEATDRRLKASVCE